MMFKTRLTQNNIVRFLRLKKKTGMELFISPSLFVCDHNAPGKFVRHIVAVRYGMLLLLGSLAAICLR